MPLGSKLTHARSQPTQSSMQMNQATRQAPHTFAIHSEDFPALGSTRASSNANSSSTNSAVAHKPPPLTQPGMTGMSGMMNSDFAAQSQSHSQSQSQSQSQNQSQAQSQAQAQWQAQAGSQPQRPVSQPYQHGFQGSGSQQIQSQQGRATSNIQVTNQSESQSLGGRPVQRQNQVQPHKLGAMSVGSNMIGNMAKAQAQASADNARAASGSDVSAVLINVNLAP